jgi:hypothetical protein
MLAYGTARSNKAMKLTKLSPAPLRGRSAGSCPRRPISDAGTASQLIASVGPTRGAVKAVAACIVLWAVASRASAMCPYPVPKACSYYFTHDAVFVGQVLTQFWADEEISFRLRVSKVLRGRVGATAVVHTGNDSGRVQWDVGRTYVVFAERREGRLWAGNDCGPLSDPAKVDEVVQQILALRDAKGSTIEGEVLDAQAVGNGVPGVSIRVVGQGRQWHARSDAKGLFRVQVPPGRYRMPLDANRTFQSDYSWTDLSDIVLTDGQCAQVQLVAQ